MVRYTFTVRDFRSLHIAGLVRRFSLNSHDRAPVATGYGRVGDRGILRGFDWGDQAERWQHACCLADVNDLIVRCLTQADWVHVLLAILLEKKLRFVESKNGAKFELIETCGGALGIEEHIVANGCDASETLAPISIGGNQEPREYAKKIVGRLALIGGVDQFNVVSEGTPDHIRFKAHGLFESVGQHGGYLYSLVDHLFETDLDKLQAYADAARECVY